jgi:broad specificity phosphatase PhoE
MKATNKYILAIVQGLRAYLTNDQAEEAGHRLRQLLRPDDTLQIFTSPYRRTRETTEGILKTLTSTSEDGPSPFSRSKIKLYEEPRLREQDFGNFQPGSDEMERMWRERADYGHFFYRIPNGESAADAYDRVSGFNESLWRQFGDKEFPSVLVLVTHGLMTRVFLMKWYAFINSFRTIRKISIDLIVKGTTGRSSTSKTSGTSTTANSS